MCLNKSTPAVLFFSAIFLLSTCSKSKDPAENLGIGTYDEIVHPTRENIPTSFLPINFELTESENSSNYSDSESYWTIGQQNGADDTIFGEIKDVVILNNFLILLDSKFNDLRIYDLEEKELVNRYLLSGRGPGEFLSPSSIALHNESSTLFLTDRYNKINAYSIDNGEISFEYQIDVKFVPVSSCVLNDELIVSGIKVENEDSEEAKRTNIHSFSVSNGDPLHSFGEIYKSNNWLTVNQLSDGYVGCSNSRVLFSFEYLPFLYSYYNSNIGYKQDWILNNEAFNTMEIVESINEGRPAITFRSNEAGFSEATEKILTDPNEGTILLINKIVEKGTSLIQYRTVEINLQENTAIAKDRSAKFTIFVSEDYTIVANNENYPKLDIYEN